jgi:two-component system sensor histidine kinase UhpB
VSDALTAPIDTVRRGLVSLRERAAAEFSAALRGEAVATLDLAVALLEDLDAHQEAERELQAAKAELEGRVAERTAALARANEELQHELSERLRVEAAQRESEERFAEAFQHAPVGMALADAHGRVFSVNDVLCELLGYSQHEFLGKSGRDLVYPDDLPAWLADGRRLAAGEVPSYHSERRYIHKSGRITVGQVNVSALRDRDGKIAEYVIQWRDITAEKEATEALRRSEERFALAIAGAKDGLWDWDIEAGKGYLSARWKGILGFAEHEFPARFEEWAGRIHPEDAERVRAAVSAHVEGRTDHFECEYRIRHKDGSYRWVLSRALAIRDATGKACRMAGSMTDITERKRAEQALKGAHAELQTLSRRLMELQEAERRHLAVELHDEIGQTLTAVKLMLDSIVRSPRKAAQQRLEEIRQLVDELFQQVRDLSLALRPPVLDDLGVLPALVWLCDRYTAQTGVKIAFQHRGLDRRFASGLETAAYRIVQEALTNVARHAGVTDVAVHVWPEDGTLHVQIADAGAGFDADAVFGAGTSGGLAGMRERALSAGGTLSIHSALGRGTTVSALFPIGEPS